MKIRILKSINKEYIVKLMNDQCSNKLVTLDIKKMLGEQFRDLKSIIRSKILRNKKILNNYFKKMTIKQESALTKESLERMLEEASIWQKLFSKDIDIIYINGLSVSTSLHQFYG